MSNPFVAEIRIFAGDFAPYGWAQCNGQLIPLSQNTALFSLLGTTFGGDGKSNFALPNLQGSAPMQQGQGPGLSLRDLGETGGEQTVTLLQTEMPAHPHSLQASAHDATISGPGPQNSLARSNPTYIYKTPSGPPPLSPMANGIVGFSGGGLPHNNMQPFLGLTFIIALQGVFPARP
ncbi:MAG: phage tail protein [Streptosporangiaceae bacterium]